MTLLECLSEIEDFRRKEGRRYELSHILMMVILGMMSGHSGFRPLWHFMKANATALSQVLGIAETDKHYGKVPSYVTIRTVLQGVNYASLEEAFRRWCAHGGELPDKDWIALDGKSLGSTVDKTQARSSLQDFVQVVTAFSHSKRQVLSQQSFEQTKSHEGEVVQQVIKELDLKGVHYTLDALHCSKKHST